MTRDEILANNPLLTWLESRGVKITNNGTRSARCPMKEHTRADNVSVDAAKNLWHCHACDKGGTVIDWLALEKGIPISDAMRELGGNGNKPPAPNKPRREVCAYDYHDENGALLFQVVRFEPKTFRQRRPDGNGGWTWKLDGVRRVLYRLPEVLNTRDNGERVYVVEGEKDADALTGLGLCATCNAGGAEKWMQGYTATLTGAQVVIIPDKDTAGRKHAALVLRELEGKADSVRVVELPDREKRKVKDAADWIAAGGTLKELKKIILDAPAWTPPAEPVEPSDTDEPPQIEDRAQPAAIDAGEWIDAEPPAGSPIVEELFENGDKVLIVGSSKSRKSFFVLQIGLAIASGKRHVLDWNIPAPCRVLLLNAELKPAHLQRRLHHMAKRMGIVATDLDGRLRIINTRGHNVTPELLLTWTLQNAAQVLITDPVYKLLPPGLSENDGTAWRPILAGFDKIMEETGAAVLYVHHNAKGRAGDRDARDRGAGSGIVARDYDAGIYITEHRDHDDCLVVQSIVRNYAPRAPFTVRFVDRLFETADEVAPVEKTSTNARPKVTVSDAVVLEAVGTGEKPYGELLETIHRRGYTKTASKEAIPRCTVAGILSVRHEASWPRRTFYSQTNGTNQRMDQQENA